MEVDTNELLSRIGAVLRGISNKLDRVIELGEKVERASRSQEMPEGWGEHQGDHLVGAGKMVAEEPKKEAAEHPAGPKPDPGDGYRLLSKDPPEKLQEGDEHQGSNGLWIRSVNAQTHRQQALELWYRRKIEQAKEPAPAWEPKVGDWVRVTRPEDWRDWKDPLWREEMHHLDGKVLQVQGGYQTSFGHRVRLDGVDWFFHRDWLTPSIKHFAEPPEPEYREPVLPADVTKQCEFSMTGKDWYDSLL